MGLFFLGGFLIVFAIYLLLKVLMLIFLLVLCIYLIVKIARRKKVGKIILLPIISLSVLQVLTLPIDAPAIYSTCRAAMHRIDIAVNDYATMEYSHDDYFKYDGTEYVNLDEHIDKISMDAFLEGEENFAKETSLVFKSNSKRIFMILTFFADKKDVFVAKTAPDNNVLFIKDYGDEIWCPVEDYETYKQTYTDPAQYNFYITYTKDGIEKQQEIDFTTFNAIFKCEEKRNDDDSSYFSSVNKKIEPVKLSGVSKDGRVFFDDMCHELCMINGKLYYYYENNQNEHLGRYLNVTFN